MMRYPFGLMLQALVCFRCIAGCNDDHGLKSQSNASLTFYGRTVDQSGQPLSNVKMRVTIWSFPAGWSMADPAQPMEQKHFSIESGGDGMFSIDIVGEAMKVESVDRTGYRDFYDVTGGRDDVPFNRGFHFIADGKVRYRSDRDNPAVFVLVKDGVREVAALPSAGGDRLVRDHWVPNRAGWPHSPSLRDVSRATPTTAAASDEPTLVPPASQRK